MPARGVSPLAAILSPSLPEVLPSTPSALRYSCGKAHSVKVGYRSINWKVKRCGRTTTCAKGLFQITPRLPQETVMALKVPAAKSPAESSSHPGSKSPIGLAVHSLGGTDRRVIAIFSH
jgi:hypothetical protein